MWTGYESSNIAAFDSVRDAVKCALSMGEILDDPIEYIVVDEDGRPMFSDYYVHWDSDKPT